MTEQNNKRKNALYTQELKEPNRRTDRVLESEAQANGSDRERKSTDLAQETRENRIKMHELIAQGYAEYHALAVVFPGDSNRRRQLKIWQQHGLWPIQPGELQLRRDARKPSKDQVIENPEQASPPCPEKSESNEHAAFEKLVTEIVRKEIKRQFDKVAISPIPKTGKAGKRAIKKAFSLPSDLWDEVEKMFPGEIMSNVIAAAIRMYVNWKKEVDGQKN